MGDLGRLRARRAVAAGERGGGPAGAPGGIGTWTRCLPCSTGPRTSPTRYRRARLACSRTAWRAGDRRRHQGRARGQGRLRPHPYRAELVGDDFPVSRVAGTSHRWLSLSALVVDLRRAADTARPPTVRRAAAAQLAAAGVRAAHPREWYALTELSDAAPIVAAGEAVRLSPSQVESFTRCGLRWLLEAAVGAGRSDVLRHLGTVIHAAAVLATDGTTE